MRSLPHRPNPTRLLRPPVRKHIRRPRRSSRDALQESDLVPPAETTAKHFHSRRCATRRACDAQSVRAKPEGRKLRSKSSERALQTRAPLRWARPRDSYVEKASRRVRAQARRASPQRNSVRDARPRPRPKRSRRAPPQAPIEDRKDQNESRKRHHSKRLSHLAKIPGFRLFRCRAFEILTNGDRRPSLSLS